MRAPKVDNNTFEQKTMLRVTALNRLRQLGLEPVIMETHGGYGDVWSAVYRDVKDGVVFEKKRDRANYLAHQRPCWAVYECDCVSAVKNGAGRHLTVNLLDCDPYGSVWDVIYAYFSSERPFAEKMIVVINDGMRQKTRAGGAWDTEALRPIVERWGNDLWEKYLEACQWLLEDAVNRAGYELVFFDGYYCGVELKMTHFLAELASQPCS